MAEKDPDDKIIPVGPGVDTVVPTEDPHAGEDPDQGYAYEEDGDDRAHAAQDARTGHSDEDPDGDEPGLTREQKKRRRRRERYESAVRERDFYRARTEQLERERTQDIARIETRQAQSDVLTIDGRIAQAEKDIREAETYYTQARKANDPDIEIDALRARDQLKEGLQQLRGIKAQTVRSAQERKTQQEQAPQRMDPAISARADAWVRQHSWFDPQLGDEDSAIARTVEARVAQEGRYSPATDAYWQEVDRRLAKRLPERYRRAGPEDEDEDEDDDAPPRRAPARVNGDKPPRRASGPTIKVGGRERSLKKGEVYIDESRRAALQETGKWDDPVARERALKYFQEYDRAAGRRPR